MASKNANDLVTEIRLCYLTQRKGLKDVIKVRKAIWIIPANPRYSHRFLIVEKLYWLELQGQNYRLRVAERLSGSF